MRMHAWHLGVDQDAQQETMVTADCGRLQDISRLGVGLVILQLVVMVFQLTAFAFLPSYRWDETLVGWVRWLLDVTS